MAINKIMDIDHLLDDSPPMFQQFHFPSSLLCCLQENRYETSQSITKYHFVMSLSDFNTQLEPLFDEKETSYYTEYFYDSREESIMKQNLWIKIIKYRKGENRVSIKRTNCLDDGMIEYKEKIMKWNDALNIPGFIELLNEDKFEISVERTKYVCKNNESILLTRDKATFEDDNSFVVFSIVSNVKIGNATNSDLYEAHPCRSKIIELISKQKKDLYKSLIENGSVKDMVYKSMSEAEFEAGPEEAEKRRNLAELERVRMLEENKYLDEEDRYSNEHIRTWYRCVLKYGLFSFSDEDE